MRRDLPASHRRSDQSQSLPLCTTILTFLSNSASRCEARQAGRIVRPASSSDNRKYRSIAAKAISSFSDSSAASIISRTSASFSVPAFSQGWISARRPASAVTRRPPPVRVSQGNRWRTAAGNVRRAFDAKGTTSVQMPCLSSEMGFQVGGRPVFMGRFGIKYVWVLHKLSKGCKQGKTTVISSGWSAHLCFSGS